MWRKFTNFQLSSKWILSPPINESTFRLNHSFSNPNNQSVVALLALAKKATDIQDKLEIYSPIRIYPREELEVIELKAPFKEWQPCLAVRQLLLPEQKAINWSITVDMPLYNLNGADTVASAMQATSVIASTPTVNNSVTKVLSANSNRKSASFYNPSNNTKVYLDVLNTVSPTAASIVIPPGSVYISDLPWIGDVYAIVSNGSVTLQVRQFI